MRPDSTQARVDLYQAVVRGKAFLGVLPRDEFEVDLFLKQGFALSVLKVRGYTRTKTGDGQRGENKDKDRLIRK